MKKTIGTVRAMVLGGMLGMALHCEGMLKPQDVAGLLYTTHRSTIMPLWDSILGRLFDPRTKCTTPDGGSPSRSLLKHAAAAGLPKVLLLMDHLDALEVDALAILLSNVPPGDWAEAETIQAAAYIFQTVLDTHGLAAVRASANTAGLPLTDIIADLTADGYQGALEALRAGGFPINYDHLIQ